jgi:hypothetical protein
MTSNHDLRTTVAAILREGLAVARSEGASEVAAQHLSPAELETLTEATLAHLRSTPGKPSPTEGWTLVTARDAAVLTWWTEVAALSDGERRRVAPLRRDVYGILAERNLIAAAEGRSTSVHVSPAPIADADATVPEGDEPDVLAEVIEAGTPGAWVLKLSPYLYDVNRVFAAPDRRVRIWSVEDHERSAEMQYGDPVYLWVEEGHPYVTAGVWGVGYVAGPTVGGIADDGWLDSDAASRASVFAVVDIALLDVPVSHLAFLGDPRLVDAETLRDPLAPNPGVLTPAEAAALAEYLPAVSAPVELAFA